MIFDICQQNSTISACFYGYKAYCFCQVYAFLL